MRLFRYGSPGQERPAAFDRNGAARDIGSILPDLGGRFLDPRVLQELATRDLEPLPVVPANSRIGPCVADVRHFIAVGLNYTDHAAESGFEPPTEPVLFNKAPSCICGPNDEVEIPRRSVKTDWEVELAVVIGARCYRISEEGAEGVVAGYCICHDLSERSSQMERGGQWMKGKSYPGFGPLGPWLVTPDELGDVQALGLWLDVNGERVQTGDTRHMIFGVRALISYISGFMVLEPGDVITTGTPAGVGLGMKPPRYLKAGDVVELGIDRLGRQRQRLVAAP